MVAFDDAGMRARKIADDDQRVLERLERLENRRQLEALAGRLRRPLVDNRAVGYEDRAEAPCRHGGGRVERRQHRFKKRQRDRRANAAQKRSSRQ